MAVKLNLNYHTLRALGSNHPHLTPFQALKSSALTTKSVLLMRFQNCLMTDDPNLSAVLCYLCGELSIGQGHQDYASAKLGACNG